MQRSRYTHTAKQVFPYSQGSKTGSLHSLSTSVQSNISTIGRTIFIIGGESNLIGSIFDVFSSQLLRKIGKI